MFILNGKRIITVSIVSFALSPLSNQLKCLYYHSFLLYTLATRLPVIVNCKMGNVISCSFRIQLFRFSFFFYFLQRTFRINIFLFTPWCLFQVVFLPHHRPFGCLLMPSVGDPKDFLSLIPFALRPLSFQQFVHSRKYPGRTKCAVLGHVYVCVRGARIHISPVEWWQYKTITIYLRVNRPTSKWNKFMLFQEKHSINRAQKKKRTWTQK